MKQIIQLKRAYDPASPDDGYRVYIDRLWPRGLSHETFHYDSWDKFERRYKAELLANPAFSALKEEIADKPKVTLLYSSHDQEHNNAVIVADALGHSV